MSLYNSCDIINDKESYTARLFLSRQNMSRQRLYSVKAIKVFVAVFTTIVSNFLVCHTSLSFYGVTIFDLRLSFINAEETTEQRKQQREKGSFNENEAYLDIQNPAEIKCGVWLAPSTIPGAGLGMFAGRDFQIREEILPTGDSIVAIVDFLQHTEAIGKSHLPFLWTEYTWEGAPLLAGGDGRYQVELCSPGFGAAANSFLPIYNVDEWWPMKDTTGLHRSLHPSVGSFSPYHNRKSTARVAISAGQELFVTYSAQWFESRPHLGPIPLDDDFDHAQVLIEAYKSLLQKVGKKMAAHVWSAFVGNTVFSQSRVIGSFNHDDEEMHILTQNNRTLSELRKQQMSRSLSWLRQHGTCGDHIAAGLSTLLPGAGRGAFASRYLPKGTIVAQLPMIHIPDRTVLEMYNFVTFVNDEDVATYIPHKDSGRMGFQLLLNYCYGHRQSTLLLCPYSPLTNYVNHNQTLANVNLRWARPESGNHMPELLTQQISVFGTDATAKLAMELIATRAIAEGEEIILDYGDDWEQAWQEHIKHWKPVQGAERYRSAADLNADLATQIPSIFDQLDGAAEPFLPNVELKCDASFERLFSSEWKQHFENGTMGIFLEFHDPEFWPCIILRSEMIHDKSYFYTVHMYKIDEEDAERGNSENENSDSSVQPGENLVVENLPRLALRFFDMPYTDDTFLPNAFRHEIGIPDDLFPETWKNIE